jgi:hypothetical protein
MRALVVLFSIAVTMIAFFFYMLGLMHLKPLALSGLVFFLSLLVTVRLLTQRKKTTI